MKNQVQTLTTVLRKSNYQASVWQKYNMNRVYIKKVCGVPNTSKLYVDYPQFDNSKWDGTVSGCLDNSMIMVKTKKGYVQQASEQTIGLIEAIVDYHS